MANKFVIVTLYRPDGGTILQYNNVEVKAHNLNGIEFTRRDENEDGTSVTVTDYKSNLPYVISETIIGPKNLI